MKILADDSGTVKNTLQGNLPNASGDNVMTDNTLITNILNWGYVLAGIVAVGFIVYGAWKYISANGEPEKIKSATSTILYSVIGMVIILLAAAVTNFALGNLGGNAQ
ncbi:MAG: hypothetical protein HUJ63_11200 [Enterococcus sp.]|nr:hypothetical protein [Enterococcus sp.]